MVAKILNFIGWASVILSVLLGIFSILNLATAVTGFVSGFLLIGFAEIIDLLQKIYVNTKKTPPNN